MTVYERIEFPADKKLFTVAEAAQYLGKSHRWLGTLCNQGRLGERVGFVWMIKRSELDGLVMLPRGAPKRKKPSKNERRITKQTKAHRERREAKAAQ
jgi:hypothetical protein